ncbi:hypothetical protein BB934_29340 (plasmid) [Microvirga ossetica]|uniref:ABC transmembrane type-1 domain-containing protein n=1 Tax=Microvirga ossetica TaxID=1882682 RepID=A0A1B2EQZ5_9HYPH|nr:hypothetical protein BB934_29340 [Microvirga ossetica]
MSGFYRLLWRQTRQAQLLLIGLSLAIAVLAAVPLYLQLKLINGLAYGTSLHQVLVLGASYGAASLLTIALKLCLQYRSAILGETIVRRIRGRILSTHAHKRRTGDPTRTADGTVVSMLTAEAEGVGLFVGEAITTPLLEIGTLLSILIFITVSEPLLGVFIAAIALPQAAIVAAVQGSVNTLVKKRLELLRTAADRAVDAAAPGLRQRSLRRSTRSSAPADGSTFASCPRRRRSRCWPPSVSSAHLCWVVGWCCGARPTLGPLWPP